MMRDTNYDWCFEGGCTYSTGNELSFEEASGTDELETMYLENCVALHD